MVSPALVYSKAYRVRLGRNLQKILGSSIGIVSIKISEIINSSVNQYYVLVGAIHDLVQFDKNQGFSFNLNVIMWVEIPYATTLLYNL